MTLDNLEDLLLQWEYENEYDNWCYFDDAICIILNINLRIYQNTLEKNPQSRFFMMDENTSVDFQKFDMIKSQHGFVVKKLRQSKSDQRKRG